MCSRALRLQRAFAACALLAAGWTLGGCGIVGIGERRSAAERPVVTPAPARPATTVVVTPPTPPPQPATRLPHGAEEDAFGFTGDRYLELLTPSEMDVLRLRARGEPSAHLARFLTTREKDNLRRRASELTEIGAEPLRIGE